jgi:sulfur relay (sulfurtransferase) DsrF/TusC family protein
MKNVTVIVSSAPSGEVAEVLRMAVGLSLEDGNLLRVVLVDDGVYAGLGHDKKKSGIEIEKSFSTLEMLKKEILAVKPSLESRGITLSRFGIRAIDREQFAEILREPGVVIG